MKSPTVPFALPDDAELAQRLQAEGLRLTPGEARRVASLLGRDPSRVEAVLFDALWSEHCSYKSSRPSLKEFLPTEAPHVILGPGEDAGVVYLTTHRGERWALVVGHESHNHPSQVVPFEGAATGIGGIVRDVYCMGAEVIGVLDALRFGSLEGPSGERSREIANGVVEGIWHYANALGVPNLGGDVVFSEGYDDNCLVNVVAVGIVRERDVVRSRVPQAAREVPYVLVLVGKPTDASGFGGASFASADLDESRAESDKGAVQVPDPFLKRVLTVANARVLALVKERGVLVGWKDLGAGGIACASSELAGAGGFGADLDLGSMATSLEGLPPEVLACSETQERYLWAVPETLAEEVLRIYNADYALPELYPGAGARVVGRVRTEDTLYRITHQRDVVCEVPVAAITHGVTAARPVGPPPSAEPEPELSAASDLSEALASLLTGPLASREGIYRFYDTEVQGRAFLRPGEADASVLVPIEGCPLGLAVGVGGNPFYGERDAYLGGANAVAEAIRNVVASGALPWCLTDCLNYGSPEDPAVFRQFREGVRGIGDAARGIGIPGERDVPVPVVSGNVSFYNQSSRGAAIPPSPIVACFGVLENYTHAVTHALKQEGDRVLIVGERRRELGGSAYWRHLGVRGGAPPSAPFAEIRREITFLLDAIDRGAVLACHDISEGGAAGAAAEMALSGGLGLRIELPETRALAADAYLFTESGGFLVEVSADVEERFLERAKAAGVFAEFLGIVVRQRSLSCKEEGREVLSLDLEALEPRWRGALREALQ